METKKIVFASIIIGMMLMSTVFFSPQKVEAQSITSVDSTGMLTNEYSDFINPTACTIQDAVYASGLGFEPNDSVDIFITTYPTNGNQNGVFSTQPPAGTPTISLTNINALLGYTTVNSDANGNFYTELIWAAPVAGFYNLIGHEQDGSQNWSRTYDAIDEIDNYGFFVDQCEQRTEAITVSLRENYGNNLGVVDFSNDGHPSITITIPKALTAKLIPDESTSDTKSVDNTSTGPVVFVVYPDDQGQLYADGDYQILTPIDSSDIDFGYSTASGDFNHDGYGDLAIGVPDEQVSGKDNSGAVYVYYGMPGKRFSDPIVLTELDLSVSVKKNDSFGFSLAVGNFNGDNYDDLAIGIPNHPISGNAKAGMVSVIYGSNGGLDTDNTQKWYQDSSGIHGVSQTGDRFGFSLTTGDFDGNGYDDLAIGVPYEDVSKQQSAGAVNVIYGGLSSGDGLYSTNNQLWHQNSKDIHGKSEKNDYFGWSLTTGNFNGDNYDDLVIGVPYEGVSGVSDAGAVNVIYGGPGVRHSLDSYDNQIWYQGDDFRIDGFLDKNDNFGFSLTSGDFNNDTFDDLAIGVPNEMINDKSNVGAVNVIYGDEHDLFDVGNQLWSLDTTGIIGLSQSGQHFGWSIVAADFNSDGVDDLAIGIPDTNIGSVVDVGAISMIYGKYGLAEAGWGLNADGNQYWYPG